jgi:glycosyltransferase involved in cell wall biosynthesis/SAM-dependent methyltransferase
MKSSRERPDSQHRERSSVCWCGNEDLKPFSDDYLRCARCETLVLRHMPVEDVTRVRDDSADLYGRNYYLKHLQEDFGYPDLKTRARTDLPERCLHWLRTTLKYKIPPGKALELGSAHGAFVALLRWTGFGAIGLELSPWVVNFAKGVFDVPVLSGPIEDQKLAPRSLDVIALMDVLEHLPSPLATMERCLRLLKKDGVLVIQTPRYPEAGSYEKMIARRDPFLEQLKSSDHLYLYSQKSVQEFLRRLGAGHVAFEPAIFARYDMFLVASPARLSITPREKIEAVLSATPASRLIQALLDTDDRSRDLQERLGAADADRASRLEVIHQQGRRTVELEAEVHRWLEETKKYSAQAQQLESLRAGSQAEVSNLETERGTLQARVTELQQRLETSETDRAARLESILRLEQLLGESERDRTARLGVIQTQGAQAVDLQRRLSELQQRLETSEADRAARLENIRELERLLKESERDRAARLGVIETQGAQVASLDASLTELQQLLKTSEADRAARLKNIERFEQLLGESERDRAARLTVIQTQSAQVASLNARLTELQQLLETSEADRAARLGVIQNQTAQVASLQAQLAELHQSLESSEAAGVAHGEEINKQRQMLEKTDSKQKRSQIEISYLKAHAGAMQNTLQQLGHSHTFRLIRALGSWRSLDRSIAAITETESAVPHPSSDGPQKTLRRVVVDLTPVLPGADNGGAKLLALELVRQLAQLAPSCEWILLTSEKGHADLASLDSQNVRRMCLGPNAARPSVRSPGHAWLSRLGRRFGSSSGRDLLRESDADVIFCPFTTARFFDSRVPLVSIVYDLQYLAYPEFFSGAERGHRDREFRNVCRFASRLVCISDHVRRAVLEHVPSLDPSRVTTIHISLFHRLADSRAVNAADVLSRLGLSAGRFLLYPANYWAHKNHEMLLTAFGMYHARHPESDLKLVCTGGLSTRREELQEAGARMGLNGELVLTEYLPNEEFAVLLRVCAAMVFPSLFEGFGMPVLEAMAADKPVLCSNLTSLPEVVGDAAVLFDPRKPTEIVQAIERIESDPKLAAQLIQRGRNRLAAFDDTTGMARRYLHLLQDALDGGKHLAPTVHGVFADGWTGDHVTIMHNPSGGQRYLEMTLYAPPWLPSENLSIRTGTQTHVIKRDQTVTLRHRLPAAGGALEIQIHPTFQPQAQGMGTDTRILGCLCRSCRILSPDETVELFAEVPQT